MCQTVCQKKALFILHPDKKNFKLHPAIQFPNIFYNFLYILFFVIGINNKKLQFSCYSLKMPSKHFFLLDKNFASRLGLPLHPDRGKYFFGTLHPAIQIKLYNLLDMLHFIFYISFNREFNKRNYNFLANFLKMSLKHFFLDKVLHPDRDSQSI